MLEKTPESPMDCKEIQPVNLKGNKSWIFIGRTDAETETPIFGNLMQRTDSLEKTLMLGKIEDKRRRGSREWDGKRIIFEKIGHFEIMSWIASPTQWTWVWASSRRWWRTGKPHMLQSMGSQRVGHVWETEQQQWGKKYSSSYHWSCKTFFFFANPIPIFLKFLDICFQGSKTFTYTNNGPYQVWVYSTMVSL